jgi:hypothetical protein
MTSRAPPPRRGVVILPHPVISAPRNSHITRMPSDPPKPPGEPPEIPDPDAPTPIEEPPQPIPVPRDPPPPPLTARHTPE